MQEINNAMKRNGTLTKAEFNAVHNEWLETGSKELFDRMVLCNLGLLMIVSSKRAYASDDLCKEDLFQAAYFGLERAIEKFDASKGYTFSTYAVTWIKDMVQRHVEVVRHPIRIPTYRAKELIQYGKAIAALGGNPSGQEIIDWCKKNNTILAKSNTAEYIERALREKYEATCSSNIVDDKDITVFYTTDNGDVLAEELNTTQVTSVIVDAINSGTITEREKVVLCHRFELLGRTKLSHKAIGEIINTTRGNVQKIEVRGLQKLKELTQLKELSEAL